MDRKDEKQIEMLLKILIVLFIILIIVDLMGCREAKAATITGEKQLGGISLLRQQVIDADKTLPEYEDIALLAEVMYHENWHTDKDHLTARWTGAVVLNRVKHKNYPNTIKSVLYQKNPTQYSTTHKFFTVELPKECYEMAIDLLKYGSPDVPENVTFQATFRQGSGLWRELNGEKFCYE